MPLPSSCSPLPHQAYAFPLAAVIGSTRYILDVVVWDYKTLVTFPGLQLTWPASLGWLQVYRLPVPIPVCCNGVVPVAWLLVTRDLSCCSPGFMTCLVNLLQLLLHA